ncbi:hypothetical protein VP01_25g2, partial [Puccinia sorghi]
FILKNPKKPDHLRLCQNPTISRMKSRKKKNCRGPYCAPGKNNPEASSHNTDHCWKLHPELRPTQFSKGSCGLSHTLTTQLVEVKDGHELAVLLLLTEEASKPIFLDSAVTHHLVNNLDVFLQSSGSNIKIANGGHSNFLNATAVVLHLR